MRHFSIAITSMLLTIVGLATASNAEVSTIFRKGVWEAGAGTAEDGTRVCTVSTNSADRYFAVKYFEGEPGFVVHIFKDGWRIPDGISARIALEFDEMGPWSGEAQGINSSGISGLELGFALDKLPHFAKEFRAAQQITVTFLDGNEGPWSGGMAGSAASLGKMLECMDDLAGPSTSQPFNRPNSQPFSTQPFSGPSPAPTAPSDPRDPFVINPDARGI